MQNLGVSSGFFEHAEEFRKKIIWILIFLLVATVISFFFIDKFMVLLRSPIESFPIQLNYFKPEEKMLLHVRAAFFVAMILTVPFALFQAWAFMVPGLHKHERLPFTIALIMALLLFSAGSLLSWKVITPFTFAFLVNFGGNDGISQMWGMASYYQLLFFLILVTGLVLEIPLLLLVLIKIGLVRVNTLIRFRKHSLIAMAILMALLTSDIFSLVFLTIILYLMFELTILIGRFIEKRRMDVL